MTPHPERTAITFLLDAPEAQRVTLEGTFNYWGSQGDIVLYCGVECVGIFLLNKRGLEPPCKNTHSPSVS